MTARNRRAAFGMIFRRRILAIPKRRARAYQLTSEQYAVNEVSQYVRKIGAPNHCGGANWIFSDSTSGGRVACEVCRASGEVDGVRLPKEAYYVCQAMFRDDPQVHIIGHWNYPAGHEENRLCRLQLRGR